MAVLNMSMMSQGHSSCKMCVSKFEAWFPSAVKYESRRFFPEDDKRFVATTGMTERESWLCPATCGRLKAVQKNVKSWLFGT